jgi:flagella basal body P-ring formation protein FlgA
MRRGRLVVALLLGVLAGTPAPAWAGVRVRLAPEMVLDRDQILVGDLGVVEGDEPLASRLRAIRVGPAPAAGTTVRIDAETLRLKLRLPPAEAARVELDLPERVVVTRAFQVVPGAALVEAARRAALPRVEAALDPREGAGPPALVPNGRPDDLRVPTGSVRLDARVQEGMGASTFVSVTVTVTIGGREHQAVPVTFRVARYRTVVVAARPLEPRTALGAGDFRTEPRPSTELPPDALAEVDRPADLEVVRAVQPGEVVTARTVRPRIVVRRGETVTLLVEARGFRVSTVGQAAEDARRGDTVRVINPTSKREVLGTAEGNGLVRVPFRELRSEP